MTPTEVALTLIIVPFVIVFSAFFVTMFSNTSTKEKLLLIFITLLIGSVGAGVCMLGNIFY